MNWDNNIPDQAAELGERARGFARKGRSVIGRALIVLAGFSMMGVPVMFAGQQKTAPPAPSHSAPAPQQHSAPAPQPHMPQQYNVPAQQHTAPQPYKCRQSSRMLRWRHSRRCRSNTTLRSELQCAECAASSERADAAFGRLAADSPAPCSSRPAEGFAAGAGIQKSSSGAAAAVDDAPAGFE